MSRPKKPSGTSMRELNAMTGTSPRQVYGWMRAGLLPHPTSSGRGVRYDAAFVERAVAIARLREEGLFFDEIRDRLEHELRKPRSGPEEPAASAPAASPVTPSAERWERLVLLPGLELSYRTDAGPVLRRLAAEIWKQYGAHPPG